MALLNYKTLPFVVFSSGRGTSPLGLTTYHGDYSAIWMLSKTSPIPCLCAFPCLFLFLCFFHIVPLFISAAVSVSLSMSMPKYKWRFEYFCPSWQLTCRFPRPVQGGKETKRVSKVRKDGQNRRKISAAFPWWGSFRLIPLAVQPTPARWTVSERSSYVRLSNRLQFPNYLWVISVLFCSPLNGNFTFYLNSQTKTGIHNVSFFCLHFSRVTLRTDNWRAKI